MSITVAIVEDDKNFSNALKKIIENCDDLDFVGHYENAQDAIHHLPTLLPNVILMDIRLPDISGIKAVSFLKSQMERSSFIMCTSYENDQFIYESLKAGASGYLIKGESMEKIIQSIKEVYKGGAPMSFGIAKKVLDFFRNNTPLETHLKELTLKENEILQMLAQGFIYKEIADKKIISIDTVKKHIGSIYRKLQVNNKIEAINKFNENKKDEFSE